MSRHLLLNVQNTFTRNVQNFVAKNVAQSIIWCLQTCKLNTGIWVFPLWIVRFLKFTIKKLTQNSRETSNNCRNLLITSESTGKCQIFAEKRSNMNFYFRTIIKCQIFFAELSKPALYLSKILWNIKFSLRNFLNQHYIFQKFCQMSIFSIKYCWIWHLKRHFTKKIWYLTVFYNKILTLENLFHFFTKVRLLKQRIS